MNRRRFLRGAGAATILVLGGAVWYADEEGSIQPGQGPGICAMER